MLVQCKSRLARYGLAVLLLIIAGASIAQYVPQSVERNRAACERDYRPKFGQRGKDVPWEPTSDVFAAAMLRLAETGPSDVVYDLGAGDGAIVIAAAKHFGATAVGIEYNHNLATLAQCYIEAEGLAQRAKVIAGDIFKNDFSRATLVTLFLYPEVNLRLRPTLLRMQPGVRVVSHMHGMGTWKWDDEIELDGRRAYLWIVPAEAKGEWTFKHGESGDEFALTLQQRFQELTGGWRSGGERYSVTGMIRGTQISLKTNDGRRLTGVLDGDRMAAIVSDGRGTRDFIGTKLKLTANRTTNSK